MAGEKPSTPPKKLKVLLGLENRKSVRNADSPRSTWLTISYDHERALVLIPRKKRPSETRQCAQLSRCGPLLTLLSGRRCAGTPVETFLKLHAGHARSRVSEATSTNVLRLVARSRCKSARRVDELLKKKSPRIQGNARRSCFVQNY